MTDLMVDPITNHITKLQTNQMTNCMRDTINHTMTIPMPSQISQPPSLMLVGESDNPMPTPMADPLSETT